ncbi:MAG: DUF2065 domain-containing protein [Thiobacillus sp.]|nr:DUF2065 domain-containing protein [Thiobacillus sp.]
MSGGDWFAAFGLLLVIEGLLPFAVPAMWRDVFRRAAELTDGQLRFMGAASMLGGVFLLTVLN